MLVIAFGFYAALIRHLASGGDAHSDALLLLIALALVMIAVRIGEETPPSAAGGLPRFGLAGAVGIAVPVGLVN